MIFCLINSHFDCSRLYSSANEESDDWVSPYFINMDPSAEGSDIRTPQAGETNFEEEKVEVSADASSSKKRKMGIVDFEAVECSPMDCLGSAQRYFSDYY